ncbi:MAG: hypothetical protein ACE5G2_00330 [Candidatus Krumholzibacteriia bacterium]
MSRSPGVRSFLLFAALFFTFSVPLFLLWVYVLRQPYLTGLAHIFAATARLLGQQVDVVYVHDTQIRFSYAGLEWSDEFGLTGINIVPLVALILATFPLTWTRRLRVLWIGVLILLGTHILGLWSDIAHVHLHRHPIGLRFADGLRALLMGFGTFLFPVLIWLVLVRDLVLTQVRELLPRSGTRSGETRA